VGKLGEIGVLGNVSFEKDELSGKEVLLHFCQHAFFQIQKEAGGMDDNEVV